MSLAALVPQLRGFHLEQVRADADGLTVVLPTPAAFPA